MKKLIFIVTLGIVFICLNSCGGVYSIASGKADVAEISFVDDSAYDISVTVDNDSYQVKTVKDKVYRRDKKIKKTAENTISITPGKHKILVQNANGVKIYEYNIFVSANEHKVIRL